MTVETTHIYGGFKPKSIAELKAFNDGQHWKINHKINYLKETQRKND